jgi:hypothetical protein
MKMNTRGKRTLRWILAFAVIVPLSLMGSVAWGVMAFWNEPDTKPPTDSVFIGHYKANQAAFHDIAQILADQNRASKAPDIAGVRQCIDMPGAPEKTDIPPSPDVVYFPMGVYESFRVYEVKGFAYCRQPPPLENTMSVLDGNHSWAGCLPNYRHLDGNWYLFYYSC